MVTQNLVNEWCKFKGDYLPLLKNPDRTPEDMEDANFLAHQVRDWNRLNNMLPSNDRAKPAIPYNPKLHTSPIFDLLVGGKGITAKADADEKKYLKKWGVA